MLMVSGSFADFSANQLPPGCLTVKGAIGGCNGKTQIEAAKVSPECLEVSVNNCNGGMIELINKCKADIWLGSLVLPYFEKKDDRIPVWFELYRDLGGKIRARLEKEPGAGYVPKKAEKLKLEGKVGKKRLVLSYTKTGLLCP